MTHLLNASNISVSVSDMDKVGDVLDAGWMPESAEESLVLDVRRTVSSRPTCEETKLSDTLLLNTSLTDCRTSITTFQGSFSSCLCNSHYNALHDLFQRNKTFHFSTQAFYIIYIFNSEN